MNKTFFANLIAIVCITAAVATAAKGETIGEASDAKQMAARNRDSDCVRECERSTQPEYLQNRCHTSDGMNIGCIIGSIHEATECIEYCPMVAQ